MTSSTGELTSHNDCTTEEMGTEPRDLSDKTHQIGSECLDSEQRVLGTVLTNSVIDEKSNQVSANMTENSVIQLPEPPQIGSECLDREKRVLGTVLTNSVIDEKSNQVSASMTENSVVQLPEPPQIGSECLDSEKRVPDSVLTNSVIDEKSNQVSANMTENSVVQLPEPPHHYLENSCQTVDGSCLQQSTFNQVPVNLSDDKSENKCPQNLQNEPGEISDAVPGLVGEDQTQSVPVNFSDDKSENRCPQNLQNEPREIGDAVTGLVVEDQTQSVPVNFSDNKSESRCPQNLQNEPGEIGDAVTGLVEDQTQSVPINFSDVKSENKCPQNLQNEPGEIGDVVTGLVVEDQMQSVSVNFSDDKSENKCPQNIQNEPGELSDAVTGLVEDQTQSVPVNFSDDKSENKCPQNLQNEPGEISDVVTSLVVEDQMQSIPSQVNTSSVNGLLDPPSGDVAKNINSECSERKFKSSAHLRLRGRGKSNSKLLKKKYMLRSLGSGDRALRSRTRDKPKDPEPNSNVVDVNNDEMKRKRGRKKKKRRGEGTNDQFSKIRAHLRYLLNRVSYEQSLIDAYSGEGWKGYSMEKLKPEKEIQRAKSEILRRKLKIRDLFQNLDSLCAEGRLPESLFDSAGEIDSEDIFCAKCQSKALSTGNDIILCDGACDRGFHQLCLDPPLLTEDIPPGDESWLCPGCDCKDDCIELVNDSLGTSLSLSDTWERVFPEAAAAAAAGSNMDHNLGLPSDDSDDDDYNPNGPEDVEVDGGESSSDESEYASASEKLEDLRHEDQYLGLPSEDSEDDDYNPIAPDPDNKVTEESSSSDFTSDSEDLAATIEDNTPTGRDGDLISASLNDVKSFKGSSRQKSKVGKKPSVADELSSLLQPDPGQEDFTPVSGKRNVERLDYKKLYDEQYQSDTSDDEDWTDTATPSRKNKLTGKMAPVSPNGNASNNSRHTPKRNTHQNKVENTNNSPTKSLEGCVESGSRDKKPRSSSYKRLGEDVVQRLHKSFKENRYPDRTTKESLAQELGLTFQQVDKWFGNTRWSFRHSSHTETSPGRNALQQATDSRAENQGDRECELVYQGVSGEKSKTPSSRKRKRSSEPQASEAPLDVEGSAIMSPVRSPRADEMQTGKMKTRKRK